MIRKALIVMSATGSLVAALASPAVAAPTGCVTTPGLNGSLIQVCIDQNGSQRHAFVQAQAATQPVVLTVYRTRVEQCNNGGNPIACSNVLVDETDITVSGFLIVTYRGPGYTFSFGHTYRGCATVAVNGYFYGEVCSVLVPN